MFTMFHRDRVVAKVHLIDLMNVVQHGEAADPQTDQPTCL